MALTKPAGNPAQHSGISAPSKKDRGDKSYGESRAGFGLTKGGMDGIPTSKKTQVQQGRASASMNPKVPSPGMK